MDFPRRDRPSHFYAVTLQKKAMQSPHRLGMSSSRVDIPTGWDLRAKQQPTGLVAYQLTLAALFESLRP